LQLLVLDIKGKIGHFRRPDTLVTHATYPLIPRTVLHGLLASVLGLEQLKGENWIGIRLMSPVRTCTQQMSMLGKGWVGSGKEFNRPTVMELVVQPHYRIFYAGSHTRKLSEMVKGGCSHYHTYLGSAFCLTFPQYVDLVDEVVKLDSPAGDISTACVVPSCAIAELVPVEGSVYGRVGGMHYQHIGERRFRDTVNLIYEINGHLLRFKPRYDCTDHPTYFYQLESGETICLW